MTGTAYGAEIANLSRAHDLTPDFFTQAKRSSNNLTSEEMKILKEIFELFDEDGNGQITFDEFKVAIRASGETLTNNDLKLMIESADSDGNGHIDFDEFVKMKIQSKRKVPIDLKIAFDTFDTNKDGYLSKEELKSILCKRGEKMNEEEVESFLRSYDINGDGRIDLDEFINALEAVRV